MKIKTIVLLAVVNSLVFIGCMESTYIETSQMFTDNMVLQQNSYVNIWGMADPGSSIRISGSWGGDKKCRADEKGKWMTALKTAEAGGPFDLIISSGAVSKKFSNVMLGEVWVCSGQSNMEMPMISNWAQLNNAEKEISEANYPNIRLFTVNRAIAFNPVDTLGTKGWLLCDSNTVKEFSCTAYFFGKKLHNELNVPIGLIHSSWGGTVAEAWTSKASLLNLDDFANRTEEISKINISRDSIITKYEKDTKIMMDEIALADPGLDGEKALYADPDLDDSDWFPMDLPKIWEETALGNYDGSTWYRKTVNLSPILVNSKLKLVYGAPDDWDEVWFNGVKIGASDVWGVIREYEVPMGLAKTGENSITIRVYDCLGAGGFTGDENDFKLVSSIGNSIPLAKGWLTKKGFDFKDIKTMPVSPLDPNQPTVLYNAMIHPMVPFTIRGAIWYQGESNAGRAFQYRKLFKTMIQDWRNLWNQGEFPFLFVQLANYQPRNEQPIEDTWAELREAQTMALELTNTGMAVTIDIGDEVDIHPGNKQEVGKRLALNALAKVYEKDFPYMGPLYKSYKFNDGVIELTFDYLYDGLRISEGEKLKGFTIAGEDKKFVWADAVIKEDKVLVFSDQVRNPVAVRYAWSSNPECNLSNSAGLPASPFRTDDWKGITE